MAKKTCSLQLQLLSSKFRFLNVEAKVLGVHLTHWNQLQCILVPWTHDCVYELCNSGLAQQRPFVFCSVSSQAKVLNSIRHKNIVQFYGALNERPSFGIVMGESGLFALCIIQTFLQLVCNYNLYKYDIRAIVRNIVYWPAVQHIVYLQGDSILKVAYTQSTGPTNCTLE